MFSKLKLRRELDRIWQQFRGISDRITDPVLQLRLNRIVASGLPQLDGVLVSSDKIAIFLVFQPLGLSASTLETCRWLAENGYAPLVVSNGKISPEDRENLSRVVWRAVERPNFGYDFGGYRDGLLCLAQWGLDPDELLILNDSIWLPILPESDLMIRLANEPADVAGAILRGRTRGGGTISRKLPFQVAATGTRASCIH